MRSGRPSQQVLLLNSPLESDDNTLLTVREPPGLVAQRLHWQPPVWASPTSTSLGRVRRRLNLLLTLLGSPVASLPVPYEMPLIILPSARLEFAGTAPRKVKKKNIQRRHRLFGAQRSGPFAPLRHWLIASLTGIFQLPSTANLVAQYCLTSL